MPTLYQLQKMLHVEDLYREVVHMNGSYYILDLQEQIKRVIDINDDLFCPYVMESGDILRSRCFIDTDALDVKILCTIHHF